MQKARDSQRLFFISKELQLNTKFHYREVTTTSEDHEIFLCISKVTVSENRSSHRPTPCQGKNHMKGKKKERKREKEKERRREGEKERERKRRRKRKKRRKRKEKMKKAGLQSFSFNTVGFFSSIFLYKKFGFLRPKFLRSANTSH